MDWADWAMVVFGMVLVLIVWGIASRVNDALTFFWQQHKSLETIVKLQGDFMNDIANEVYDTDDKDYHVKL